MSDWETTTLGDLVELQRGHDLPSVTRGVGKVPVIGSFGVTGLHDKAKYPGPGVAIGRSGASIGKATYVADDYWPLNTCLFVSDFKGNDARWVFRLLDLTDFESFNSGSAQPSLNRNFLKSIPVSVPPLAEQRAIAEVLGALDDKIATNTRLATKSEALAIALAAASEPSTPLDDLVGVSRTMVDPSLMTVTVVKHYSLPAFDANHAPESVSPSEIKSGKFLIGRPAVLLSKLNPRFPRAWDIPVVPEDPSLASTEFVVLHPVGFSTTVLWALVSQPRFGSALEGMVAGTSGSHQRVRPADMLATPVGDPRSMPEALKKQITVLGSSATMARAENLTLVATRDALLPALMSGALRVRDAERAVERTV